MNLAIIVKYMHPWFIPVRRNGRLELDMPSMAEVHEAARVLVEGLRFEGYEIIKTTAISTISSPE